MARKSVTTRPKSQSHQGTRSGAKRTQSTRSRRSTSARTTTDHEEIRRWAEALGGSPACVRGTGGPEDVGMLRIEFPDAPNAMDENLQPIDWDKFFDKFEERGLALLYQDHRAGGQRSYFYKIVNRGTNREESPRRRSPGRRSTGRK